MLMTRAGFDPDFVPALHHLIAARPGQSDGNIFDPSHPRWGERDQRLQKFFAAAGREYDHLWPDRFASPGGNSPIVVYADLPSAKRSDTGELQVLVPLHCENLTGTVEVVLRFPTAASRSLSELRQVTGCTSNRTLVTFTLPAPEVRPGNSRVQAEISVLDDTGTLLTRSLAPIPIR
jgi:hypothetical protein